MEQPPIQISETTWLTLNGPCGKCGACCQVVEQGTVYTCENLVVHSRVGEAEASVCRVYQDRVDGMPISMCAVDGTRIERSCALGSQAESLAILDRGIGRGCSMTVGIRRAWPEA